MQLVLLQGQTGIAFALRITPDHQVRPEVYSRPPRELLHEFKAEPDFCSCENGLHDSCGYVDNDHREELGSLSDIAVEKVRSTLQTIGFVVVLTHQSRVTDVVRRLIKYKIMISEIIYRLSMEGTSIPLHYNTNLFNLIPSFLYILCGTLFIQCGALFILLQALFVSAPIFE